MPLDENDQRQVDKFQAKLAPALAEIRKWHTAINAVYEAADEEPPYEVGALETGGAAPSGSRRSYGRAEFFDQPLATVVKKLITDNGALSIDEIYDLMLSGGFSFRWLSAEKAKNNMKISLGKNMAFGCTPNGHYTLSTSRERRGGSSSSKEPNGVAAIASASELPSEATEERTTVADGDAAHP